MPARFQRYIVPDYRRPQALVVPHCHSSIRELLEVVAERAAEHVGVILLAQQKELSEAFVAAQRSPDHFHLVTAPYDTPWIRDRSPVAVSERRSVQWVLPKLDTPDRPLDEALFGNIVRKPLASTTIPLPQGNLVAGPRGRAVVLLRDEHDAAFMTASLEPLSRVLGVHRWITAPAFANELTGHADVHVRFLSPELAAIAWSADLAEDRERAAYLEQAMQRALPDIEILRLPMRSQGSSYASPLNWLQFGRHLLVPRYEITPPEDEQQIQSLLVARGYQLEFIDSPTLEYGGSLHCLTASIFT